MPTIALKSTLVALLAVASPGSAIATFLFRLSASQSFVFSVVFLLPCRLSRLPDDRLPIPVSSSHPVVSPVLRRTSGSLLLRLSAGLPVPLLSLGRQSAGSLPLFIQSSVASFLDSLQFDLSSVG